MNPYVTGQTIQMLREKRGLTQKQLAELLFVSDKTISKWETGKGLPDITLLEPLAQALHVSLPELFSGATVINQNRSANMLKTRWYVCPVCGNVISAAGEGAFHCCGIALPLHFLFRRSDIRPGYTGKALPGAGVGNASPGTGQGMALLLLQSARLVPYAPAAISKQQSAVK